MRILSLNAVAMFYDSLGAHVYLLAAGPHPRRELTLMPRLGFPCPRLGMAAGAAFFTGGGAPPLPRTDADALVSDSHVLDSAWPQARPSSRAAGPHPCRELTLMT